jgi:hypothetical protein
MMPMMPSMMPSMKSFSSQNYFFWIIFFFCYFKCKKQNKNFVDENEKKYLDFFHDDNDAVNYAAKI